jgi:hypothetical protein
VCVQQGRPPPNNRLAGPPRLTRRIERPRSNQDRAEMEWSGADPPSNQPACLPPGKGDRRRRRRWG